MYDHQQPPSAIERLTGTIDLTATQSAVIRQTYVLFGVAVFSAMAGGYIGSTTPGIVRFFTGWSGWIAAMIVLNIVPMIALAARNNPVLGVTALVGDGFLSGLAMSPLLWVASQVGPEMIPMALCVSACVFLGVTVYILFSGRRFSAPRGLLMGLFFATIGVSILNAFLHIGTLGILVSLGVGALGVVALVSSTSAVLSSPDAGSPIPGALSLFAGVFNIFVATLSLLLRLLGGGRRN